MRTASSTAHVIAAEDLGVWILTVAVTVFGALVIGVPLRRVVHTVRNQLRSDPTGASRLRIRLISLLSVAACSLAVLAWGIVTGHALVGVVAFVIVGYLLPAIVLFIVRLWPGGR